jgi:hypothetical protein
MKEGAGQLPVLNEEKQATLTTPTTYTSLSNDPTKFIPTDTFTSSVKHLRDAEAQFKAAKKQMLLVKQGLVTTSINRNKKKDLMKELKLVKLAVKAEDAAAKREVQKITGRRKRDELCEDSASELSDMDMDLPTKKKKRVLTTIDKWQQGHRAAALAAAEAKTVERVTVKSWPEAYQMLREYGFAVVENFVDLFHPDCAPSKEQRDYMYNRK